MILVLALYAVLSSAGEVPKWAASSACGGVHGLYMAAGVVLAATTALRGEASAQNPARPARCLHLVSCA
jgi:hypothetical protein